ncbi:hypothetical protein E4U48_007616 [Claviceps purpurea]|nr:hypothetical protein E4U48_007616 [Claviceps purpurea]
MSGENLPTETAAKFAAATSRDSARKLLGGIFSLDRFQYVLRFVRYLNLAESDDKLKNWCQSIWMEVGLAPDDTFKFNHDAVLERWKMYGDNPHLNFLRPTPRDVAVLRTPRAQVRRPKSKPASAPHAEKICLTSVASFESKTDAESQ